MATANLKEITQKLLVAGEQSQDLHLGLEADVIPSEGPLGAVPSNLELPHPPVRS